MRTIYAIIIIILNISCSSNQKELKNSKENTKVELSFDKSYHNPKYDKSDYQELFNKLRGLHNLESKDLIIQYRKSQNKIIVKPKGSKDYMSLDLEVQGPSSKDIKFVGNTIDNSKVTIIIEKVYTDEYVCKIDFGIEKIVRFCSVVEL